MWLKTSANGPPLLRLPEGLGVGAKGHWEASLPALTVSGGPAQGSPSTFLSWCSVLRQGSRNIPWLLGEA